MKKITKLGLVIALLGMIGFSCNEDKFLEEKPLDFFTPVNSLSKPTEFQASVNFLHNQVRGFLWGATTNADAAFTLRYGTDFAMNATDYSPAAKLNDYKTTMIPTFDVVQLTWNALYTIVTNANVVIDNAKVSTALTDAEKKSFTAQALFFRAWAYKTLANLYGGVPLVLEEIKVPRRDYVRATREQVYTQCKTDLTTALDGLDNIDKLKDGKISKQLAQHMLAEVNISLGNAEAAIAAANDVINYSGLSLMTSRFGKRKDLPGDVYRDLFEDKNYSRSSGNKEGLWIIEADYLNPASPYRSLNQYGLSPNLLSLTVKANVNGTVKTVNALMGFNESLSGRGIGWMRPTGYFFYGLWKSDFNTDIRNSKFNIVRDFQLDNVPANSPDYGKWYVADGYAKKAASFGDTIRNWYPVIRKTSYSPGEYPADYLTKDASGKVVITPFGGALLVRNSADVFKDEYMVRLAETYLLRAEAYLLKNDKTNAAKDINTIRQRAGASPVDAAKVDIDYLLDERMRELHAEELRMVVLCRMGKLADRNKKYNEKSGLSIQDYHNLWPIPFSEIERNTGAKLEQNPGYAN